MATDQENADSLINAAINSAVVGKSYRRQDGFSKENNPVLDSIKAASLILAGADRAANGIAFYSDFSRSSPTQDNAWGDDQRG